MSPSESKGIYPSKGTNLSEGMKPAAASWLYTYACHEDERELCGLELRSLLGEIPGQRHVESRLQVAPDRSPFLHERLAVQFEAETLEELEEQAGRIALEGATFKVRYLDADQTETYEGKRALERRIGARIIGKAEMKSPDRLFGFAYSKDRWVLGECVAGESIWLKHNSKPRQYSTALSTRVARAAVNIAVPRQEGLKLVDPCCGIGTVLIEALSMGIETEGFDINPLAVTGARENLKHFGFLEEAVRLGDMRQLDGRYDVLILDLPYNLCSVLPEEELLDMLRSARRLAPKAVILTLEDILPALGKSGWTIKESCSIYKGRFSRQLLIVE
ncbi:TRM11 family SAM-dependent methyltransferase [Paenibacillus physcomitrellae]|uniref:Methyltransferase n=1 Tax=Paenibacillus physcomitrellae TaxID=1619311 RepID=A0ABQ1FSD3_9BACL|nr:methyltransferase domain-containing protein [Paenibacillus physcomitrellae]GGA27607.1 methyltransferase [Paenibacillus physcomitrellae]